MNTLQLKTHDGHDVTVQLRKVNPRNLNLIASGNISDDEKARLFIAPEGRTVDENRKFYDALDDASKTEVYFEGFDLNDANLTRYQERQKKLLRNSGQEEFMSNPMFEKIMERKLDELMGSTLTTTLDTDSSETATAS